MEKINLTTKLTLDDYIKVNFYMVYRKGAVKLFTAIGIFYLCISIIGFSYGHSFPWGLLCTGLFFILLIPTMTYILARRAYSLHSRMTETMIYNVDETHIQLTGETFNVQFTWDKILGVSETKNWVLIWQNKYIANVLPKRDLSIGDLNTLKYIVRLHPSLKNSLK